MTRFFVLAVAAMLILGSWNVSRADFSPMLGDTNGDGVVDIDDLNNVRNNFGSTGLGDTDDNGTVDIDDLNHVRNNFGARSVPEPSTILLALLCTGAIGLMRRRSR